MAASGDVQQASPGLRIEGRVVLRHATNVAGRSICVLKADLRQGDWGRWFTVDVGAPPGANSFIA